jgi:hypothetical protein
MVFNDCKDTVIEDHEDEPSFKKADDAGRIPDETTAKGKVVGDGDISSSTTLLLNSVIAEAEGLMAQLTQPLPGHSQPEPTPLTAQADPETPTRLSISSIPVQSTPLSEPSPTTETSKTSSTNSDSRRSSVTSNESATDAALAIAKQTFIDSVSLENFVEALEFDVLSGMIAKDELCATFAELSAKEHKNAGKAFTLPSEMEFGSTRTQRRVKIGRVSLRFFLDKIDVFDGRDEATVAAVYNAFRECSQQEQLALPSKVENFMRQAVDPQN